MLRVRQNGGEHGGVGACEPGGGLVKESLRRGLGTICAIAELGNVQINFQYPPLRQGGLDQDRKVCFESLSKVAAPGPEKQIFGDLLADGAAAGPLSARR